MSICFVVKQQEITNRGKDTNPTGKCEKEHIEMIVEIQTGMLWYSVSQSQLTEIFKKRIG